MPLQICAKLDLMARSNQSLGPGLDLGCSRCFHQQLEFGEGPYGYLQFVTPKATKVDGTVNSSLRNCQT